MKQVKENVKTAEQLYKELEQVLSGMNRGEAGDGYSGEIAAVNEKIRELRATVSLDFADMKAETDYFSRVWPQFYSKLYYYLLLHRFWTRRLVVAPGKLPALVRYEEGCISEFFRRHWTFWSYFRCGATAILGQFTRAYSRSCVLDPLVYVLDPGTTLASQVVAKGLAFEQYRQWLRGAGETTVSFTARRYTWNETKTAAVELIKSQAEAGSISINGKPATSAQLQADFEAKYEIDLKDFDNLLYSTDTRKTGDTPYLMKLVNAFVGRKKRLRK